MTLLESGTLNVDRYTGWTEDIFRGSSRRAYINNNPGASLTAAVPLLMFRPFLKKVEEWNRQLPRMRHEDTGLFWRTYREGRAVYFMLIEFLTVATLMAPASAAVAGYLCARLAAAGVAPVHSAAIALLYALGTPVFFRAAYLNHNLLVCDAGFVALLLLWDHKGGALRSVRAVFAGLLAGYALLCDYSGIVVIGAVVLYAWLRTFGQPARRRWRVMAGYASGVLPGVTALIIYQAWAFGMPWLPSQHYMPATPLTAHGYHGFSWPAPSLIVANFFDPRFGIFAYCPALLLAFAAPFARRVQRQVPRQEMWVLFMYFGLFVLFCASNQFSWLQPLTGFRYLTPAVPALTLLALQAAQALPRSVRWGLAGMTLLESFIVAAAHQTDIREALPTLWKRHGELLWMMRLRDAGIPIASWLAVATFSLLMVACASILLLPMQWKARAALPILEARTISSSQAVTSTMPAD